MTTPDQFRQLQAALGHQQAGRISDAVKICKRLVRETPDNFECIYLLAMLHAEQRDLPAAIEMFRRAARIRPEFPDAQYNLAVALSMAARHEEAAKYYEQILQGNPRHLDARNNYAASLLASGRALEALQQYDQLIALSPASADAYNNRGMALQHLRRFGQALEDYDKAIALRPDFAQACVNRGNVLVSLRRPDDALASYRRAVALKPDFADAYNNIGNIYCDRGNYEEALEAYNQALALQVDDSEARSMRLYAKMHLCDWSNFKSECSSVISTIKRGAPAYPFTILPFSSSIDEYLHCARLFGQKYPPSAGPAWRGEIYSHDRIRIAYLSADFRQHATAVLAAGLFERHDKSRFEVTGISLGRDDNSAMRRRLKGAFERFLDARDKSDEHIADLIRKLEIDIVVDLKGFTADARPGILARCPAPIQMSYLGYPGTMASSYIHYIVADTTVIPEEHVQFYTEKIIWLPESYQVNDNKRQISEYTPGRRECGLPDRGFVFCCFNNNYKITPEMFEVWMRVLQAIDGSVLWLLEGNASASANLRAEAEKRGVLPERLIFAARTNLADHLARHRQADLFLDTLPYNAHTTASDAIWAGLPIVTCLGSAFPGRVAASLLRAAGLEELITLSLGDYETLTLRLAQDPILLASLKTKLARNRDTYPLFDTQRFTSHIEAAYRAAFERAQAGLPPDHIIVPQESG
jgi:predicted O-linked N-acetylglucosamine transferase (SPINDLY family)